MTEGSGEPTGGMLHSPQKAPDDRGARFGSRPAQGDLVRSDSGARGWASRTCARSGPRSKAGTPWSLRSSIAGLHCRDSFRAAVASRRLNGADCRSAVHWVKNTRICSSAATAASTSAAKPSELSEVIIDTTVEPKNVMFPTDARLLNRARKPGAAGPAARRGVRQSYARVGKIMAFDAWRATAA
jgi:hypothetical protein